MINLISNPDLDSRFYRKPDANHRVSDTSMTLRVFLFCLGAVIGYLLAISTIN